MTASISARTIDALTAIATGLHDIADAVRETGRAGEGRIDAQEPAGEPRTPSGGVGTSDGTCEAHGTVYPCRHCRNNGDSEWGP